MRIPCFAAFYARMGAAALLVASLGACAVPPAQPVTVKPQALALGLSMTEDGSLSPDALAQINTLLRQQGRLSRQTLVITPFTTRAMTLAARLETALREAGAVQVAVRPLAGLEAQEVAQGQSWDLELQSEALAPQITECGVQDRRLNIWPVMSHPYWSMGPLGCANRNNLAQMISDPRDLAQAKVLEAADGVVTAEAVRRYHEDEVKDLVDIDFDE